MQNRSGFATERRLSPIWDNLQDPVSQTYNANGIIDPIAPTAIFGQNAIAAMLITAFTLSNLRNMCC